MARMGWTVKKVSFRKKYNLFGGGMKGGERERGLIADLIVGWN
jgi:hypothetical protein